MSVVTVDDVRGFLGEDGDASNQMIAQMIEAAEGELVRVSQRSRESLATDPLAAKAVRLMVWLEFFATRDASKNTAFLQQERTRLLLQLRTGGRTDATAQN